MPAREQMRSVDAAWLRMDRPENTADVVALLVFDEPLPFSLLRRTVEERLLTHDRFRERVVAGALGGASWEEDPCFALAHHLARSRLPTRGRRALQRFVGHVATEPLDLSLPPWRIWLVEGFGCGSAVVAKLHHCIGDGYALVALLLSLADGVPVAPPARARTGEPPPPGPTGRAREPLRPRFRQDAGAPSLASGAARGDA